MEKQNNLVHILLIEDDEIDVVSVQRLIKKLNAPIHLDVAKNGVEALDKLYGRNGNAKIHPMPELILLDINMPKINGFEFLKVIREDPAFKNISIVVLTNSNNEVDKKTARKFNVMDYLIKPLQADDFSRLLYP